MALTQNESELIRTMTGEGKTLEDIKTAIAQQRASSPLYGAQTEQPTESLGFGQDAPNDVIETAKNIGHRWFGEDGAIKFAQEAAKAPSQEETIGETVKEVGRSSLQIGGEFVGAAADTFGELFIGAGKLVLPDETEKSIASSFQEAIAPIAESEEVQGMMQDYQWLKENDPAAARDVRASLGGINGLLEATGFKVGTPIAQAGVRTARETLKQIPKATIKGFGGSAVTDTAVSSARGAVGVAQGTGAWIKSVVTEKLPNAADALRRKADDSRLRTEQIKNSSPEVADAIKAEVPEPVINLVINSDDAQKAAYSQIVQAYKAGDQKAITEIFTKTAGDQYTAIQNKFDSIGREIGTTIKELPGGTVDMRPVVDDLVRTLHDKGFTPDANGKIKATGRTGMSTQEEQWVSEMVNKLILYGDDVSWKELSDLNSLLSRINREAYQSGVTPPRMTFIDESGKEVSENMATHIRDLVRSQIDTVAPDLRPLNAEYATYYRYLDTLDKTLYNTGRDVGINLDVGSSAQNRLRRVFSNAQTAEQYRAVAELLDDLARQEGYTGANLVDLTDFNLRVQPIFPDTIKKASLPGGIREAFGRFITGEPDPRMTQEALERMINASFKRGEIPSTMATSQLISHEGAPDLERVKYWKEKIQNNEDVEPLLVIKEGDKYGIEDGKHRFQAYQELGITDIPVSILNQ